MSESTQWEYRVKSIGRFWGTKDEEIEALLNEWGEQGWEAVAACVSSSDKVTLIAKRPLTLATRRRRSMPGVE